MAPASGNLFACQRINVTPADTRAWHFTSVCPASIVVFVRGVVQLDRRYDARIRIQNHKIEPQP